jgi:Zn-dependent metalloprotease
MKRLLISLVGVLATAPFAVGAEGPVQVDAASAASVHEWATRVEALESSGGLAVRLARPDTMIPGRRHERLAQVYEGVPVFGGELIRQSDASGPLTVFGTYYDGIDVDVTPTLGPRDVESRLAGEGGRPFGVQGGPQLLVLPLQEGGYRLAWRVRAFFEEPFDIRQVFYDAHSGQVLLDYRDIHTQAAGNATGVLGDRKKISVREEGGRWFSDDRLRPPVIATYDFRYNVNRLILFLNTDGSPHSLTTADLGVDSDNNWTDGALVDAHVYAGYVYDYLYERFGRRGLDDANIPIKSVTHALRREDWIFYGPETVGTFFVNAFYIGEGVMYYGDGLPPSVTFAGRRWKYLAGALDIVAHELIHGVTDYSSRLIYQGESGALNEAISDILATGAEFFAQPEKADYLGGEDVITPGGLRSFQNPTLYGDPDHVTGAYRGSSDNGGVHINSTIISHAFYLAIEGGQHRLGATVQGVGGANREEIERVFYRAFTTLLPPSATWSQARAATIQAARELYGGGSAAERAVTQAWAAVGVS